MVGGDRLGRAWLGGSRPYRPAQYPRQRHALWLSRTVLDRGLSTYLPKLFQTLRLLPPCARTGRRDAEPDRNTRPDAGRYFSGRRGSVRWCASYLEPRETGQPGGRPVQHSLLPRPRSTKGCFGAAAAYIGRLVPRGCVSVRRARDPAVASRFRRPLPRRNRSPSHGEASWTASRVRRHFTPRRRLRSTGLAGPGGEVPRRKPLHRNAGAAGAGHRAMAAARAHDFGPLTQALATLRLATSTSGH